MRAHFVSDKTLLKLALSPHDCNALLEDGPMAYVIGGEKHILKMIPCDLVDYLEQLELYPYQKPGDAGLAKKYAFGRPHIQDTKHFFVYLPKPLLTMNLEDFFDAPIVRY